jgi:hypothetical protein
MKKNKVSKFLIDFIGLFIAFVVSDKISDYFGLRGKPLFSIESLISIIILAVCMGIMDLIISKIIEIRERKKLNR